MNERWTGGQYSIWRFLLGAFLVAHFTQLLPYGAEVFARGGAVASAELSPLIGVLPNPLRHWDFSFVVAALLGVGATAGALLAIGWFDRFAAIMATLILAWLHGRNPLIANPSLPLLGWMLVAHAFVPARPYGSLAARLAGAANPRWALPRAVHTAAWVVLALSYSYSGYTKLLSPSWVSGDAIALVLENPLARDHLLRGWMLASPDGLLRVLTWGVLAVELLFAPLALLRRLRPWLWLAMLLAQVGFLVFLSFADLTLPMFLAHLLTFDPRWLQRWERHDAALVLFDGDCALCHATVRLALHEDRQRRLRFAPLGSLAAAPYRHLVPHGGGDTIVLIEVDGVRTRSAAVRGVLQRLGGLWLLPAALLGAMPRRIADAGYDLVGRVRRRFGPPPADVCALIPLAARDRLLG
jgi:predicted DCC family thiol-disulfide oxidoreductase YuxK